ncbi:MAG: 5'-nucleotidase C-terminal domain-containing protein [Candidatus Wallbacteria bacterium]|nr:5'-nucleotidase C-terminal domain-containing protein [Candidatus Wallbacteria bacterium]
MKKILCLMLLICALHLHAYGFKIHYLITADALRQLEQYPLLTANAEQVAFVAAMTDDFRLVRRVENFRHFIDWENYPALKSGLIPEKEFREKYDSDFVGLNGDLPYAIMNEFDLMTGFLAQGDYEMFLLHLGLAAHYCGDLFQPLHLTKYYDGYKEEQRGIHSRFEGSFAEQQLPFYRAVDEKPELIDDLKDSLYRTIMDNRLAIPAVLSDGRSLRRPGGGYGAKDQELAATTVGLLNGAAHFIASFAATVMERTGGRHAQAGYRLDPNHSMKHLYDHEMCDPLTEVITPLCNGLTVKPVTPDYISRQFRGFPRSISFFPGSDCMLESNLAEMFCDGVRRHILKGDGIVIWNGRGLRHHLDPGPVLIGDARLVFAFSNKLAVLEMRGSDIIAVFEKSANDTAVSGGLFQQSGLRIVLDRIADRIVVKSAHYRGQPLEPESWYTVATNEFLANGGDGYSMFRQSRKTTVLEQSDYDLFIELLRSGPVSVEIDRRNRFSASVRLSE